MRTIDVVVGGMYGSEAKGHATKRLVEKRLQQQGIVHNIRVGGPNAGHCVYDDQGRKWKLRQIPAGVVVPGGPIITLRIAPGSEVDPEVLKSELIELTAAGHMKQKILVVSPEATVIEDEHKQAETELVGAIGSTGKGIGAARAARLMRTARRVADCPELVSWLEDRGAVVQDSRPVGQGQAIVVEGTQGYALGLRSGRYPHVTSGDCTALDVLAQAQLNPWESVDRLLVWVVARTYPIRVAGNSGPLPNESTWADLGLEAERTTVTNKIRRVGAQDWDLVSEALRANGAYTVNSPVRLALAMVDHLHPETADVPYSRSAPQWQEAGDWVSALEADLGASVGLVMSGPDTGAFRGEDE